jgi:hypothetical protein
MLLSFVLKEMRTMFLHIELAAREIIDHAQIRYERHFDQAFPFYEFIQMYKTGDGEINLEGAKKFETFIDRRILENVPVEIDEEEYFNRIY